MLFWDSSSVADPLLTSVRTPRQTSMASGPTANAIQQRVWEGRLPLEILLAPSECRTYDKADPYLVMKHSEFEFVSSAPRKRFHPY